MMLKLYAIHDDKCKEFAHPVVGGNNADMVRQFGDLVTTADEKSIYSRHREDFSLWYIGEFDTETGSLNQTATDVCKLASGSDFVDSKE